MASDKELAFAFLHKTIGNQVADAEAIKAFIAESGDKTTQKRAERVAGYANQTLRKWHKDRLEPYMGKRGIQFSESTPLKQATD